MSRSNFIISNTKLLSDPTFVVGQDARFNFYARVEAEVSIAGAKSVLGARFDFSKEVLQNGASLSRLMTLDMRRFLRSNQCRGLDETARNKFQKAGNLAVKELRGHVEPYFAMLALSYKTHEREI